MEGEKQHRKGFLLGKFMPPHQGHVHLIEEAGRQVEELTVLVCTIKKEPIPGSLRFAWMKEMFPEHNIVHVTEEVPSYPHEHPDFWLIWEDLLKRYTDPDTEVVFSSEEYGDEVARRLDIEHVLIDKDRTVVPISGTGIRENPLENWDYIPNPVKPYFVKKVAILGPESTGKSTLTRWLAEQFDTVGVQEYGREHTDAMQEITLEIKNEDFVVIAEEHLKRVELAGREANKILFVDTDAITTQVWAEIYLKECPPDVVRISHEQQYDYYILMNIDVPWVDDGTREFPHLREWHFDRLLQELEGRDLPFVVVEGENYNERKEKVASLVRQRFFE